MKKNQVLVAVIVLMFIAAGYLNFTNSELNVEAVELADSVDMAEIGDATLVSSQPANDSSLEEDTEENMQEESEETDAVDEINTENEEDEEAEEVTENEIDTEEEEETNSTVTTEEYFTQSRLDRSTMYSQMIENYQDILDKTTVSETQKATAQNEIIELNEEQNAIMITENLIKTKGFEDLIIFINDESVSVVVKADNLSEEEVAQIQNIITRELDAEIENIHISCKN